MEEQKIAEADAEKRKREKPKTCYSFSCWEQGNYQDQRIR